MKTYATILFFGILVANTCFGQLKSSQNPPKTKEHNIMTKASLQSLAKYTDLNSLGTSSDSSYLKIRQINNLIAKADPLYILNGKTVLNNNIDEAKINPSDVESINFLPDQSAIALYGDRGINGAILINTKKK